MIVMSINEIIEMCKKNAVKALEDAEASINFKHYVSGNKIDSKTAFANFLSSLGEFYAYLEMLNCIDIEAWTNLWVETKLKIWKMDAKFDELYGFKEE